MKKIVDLKVYCNLNTDNALKKRFKNCLPADHWRWDNHSWDIVGFPEPLGSKSWFLCWDSTSDKGLLKSDDIWNQSRIVKQIIVIHGWFNLPIDQSHLSNYGFLSLTVKASALNVNLSDIRLSIHLKCWNPRPVWRMQKTWHHNWVFLC